MDDVTLELTARPEIVVQELSKNMKIWTTLILEASYAWILERLALKLTAMLESLKTSYIKDIKTLRKNRILGRNFRRDSYRSCKCHLPKKNSFPRSQYLKPRYTLAFL